jgi:energy-coupling factor transport system permease protein
VDSFASPQVRSRPRWLNPFAWWAWALGLAVMASRTTNPLVLGCIVAVAAYVVAARRPDAAWGRSFRLFLILGAWVIAIRVLLGIAFGAPNGGNVLFSLPSLALPQWAAGVRFGGDVTEPALLSLIFDGMRLATILACVGAANSLASPSRLLKATPSALYETGVAVVVALTFAPQIVGDADRLRTARRLRGRDTRGIRGFGSVAIPVLEGALEKSLHLAAAMDSRGYGRMAHTSETRRRTITATFLVALLCATIGAYATLDERIPTTAMVSLLTGSIAMIAVAFIIASRARIRTVYRRDPWRAPEWITTVVGLGCAVAAIATASAAAMQGPNTLTWPQVPLISVCVVALCALPAWLTPLPPDRGRQ